ncbi:hypothetical protein ROP_46480 [Rhodococcus opacus B4]|uniref:Uncharacterized protein n=2 Tax=Rhodococcus opacus TaxID=37919 RepID=C1BB42_RHOOB|nr:hypothetical protein ROP_46480 [Rhodococcus opacus B4]
MRLEAPAHNPGDKMYVEVTPPGPPTVREPDDFHRLSIVATNSGQAPSSVLDALLSVNLAVAGSTLDAVKLDVAALREAARSAHPTTPTPQWERSFDAMLDYAQHKGWFEPNAGTVAAHIEWMEATR